MSKTIVIKEKFANDYTTRQAGERLKSIIMESSGKIELDFIELKVASTSFFDEAIGKLSEEGNSGKEILKKIVISHIHELDYELLSQVCQSRGISPPIRKIS